MAQEVHRIKDILDNPKHLKWNVEFYNVVLFMALGYFTMSFLQDTIETADDYFVVDKILVHDFVDWSEATLHYKREPKKEFGADWYADITSIETGRSMCPAHGHHHYEPAEALLKEHTLLWYMEKKCVLPPGAYLLTTRWELPKGLEVNATSDVFRVFTPEEWERRPIRENEHRPLSVPPTKRPWLEDQPKLSE